MKKALALIALLIAATAGAQTYDASGALSTSHMDFTQTATLAALNDAVEVALYGRPGAGCAITTSNLNATAVAEISNEASGTNWSPSVFVNQDGTTSATLVFTGVTASVHRGVALTGGALRARCRLSIYASGTSSATMSATGQASRPTGGGGSGGDVVITDGAAAGKADVIGVAPSGTEQGLVVRPIVNPSGGAQPITLDDVIVGPVLFDSALDEVVVGMSGRSSAAVSCTGAGLSGAIQVQLSYYETENFWMNTEFFEPTNRIWSGPTFNNPTDGTAFTIRLAGAVARVKVFVSTFISGSVSCTLRASSIVDPITYHAQQIRANSVPVALASDHTGANAVQVQGTAAAGGAATANPVQIAGKDGSNNIQPLLTGTDRRLDLNLGQVGGTTVVTGGVAGSQGVGGLAGDNTAPAGNPNMMAIESWTDGSSPSAVTSGNQSRVLGDPEGRAAVNTSHPRSFSCAMTSTATTSTVITTCTGAVSTLAAPGAGLRIYITGFEYSSSIISTTTNFMTLRTGTGGTCGTATTSLWVGSNVAAFSPRDPNLGNVPLRGATNAEVCFIHPGAGTRWINVRGYVAP